LCNDKRNNFTRKRTLIWTSKVYEGKADIFSGRSRKSKTVKILTSFSYGTVITGSKKSLGL
jgi:hypothetical protein